MSSRSSNSLAASRRNQSPIWRWTSGSETRRRSGRGGKRSAGTTTPTGNLPLLPLPPDQIAVRQHHRHGMPVEARPQPPLILVPAQQALGLLVELLHPVLPVDILHHAFQSHRRSEVAPVIFALPLGHLLADQPAPPTPPRRPHTPATQRDEASPHPAIASLPPGHRSPRPRRLGCDQDVRPVRRLAAPRELHGEVGADGDHITQTPL